jgi:hypothetical protein
MKHGEDPDLALRRTSLPQHCLRGVNEARGPRTIRFRPMIVIGKSIGDCLLALGHILREDLRQLEQLQYSHWRNA